MRMNGTGESGRSCASLLKVATAWLVSPAAMLRLPGRVQELGAVGQRRERILRRRDRFLRLLAAHVVA